ncbi:MAG: hypothetical protein R2795_00795 [Saprospiraceae bacterium]
MGVNWDHWEGSDHYYKGAWMLHTLRHAIDNDTLWWQLFKDFYQQHALSLITTRDVVQFFNERTGRTWDRFFSQYLEYTSIPVLEYRLTEKAGNLSVSYRWNADVEGFDMPVKIGKEGNMITVQPRQGEWQEVMLFGVKSDAFRVAEDLFLIKHRQL